MKKMKEVKAKLTDREIEKRRKVLAGYCPEADCVKRGKGKADPVVDYEVDFSQTCDVVEREQKKTKLVVWRKERRTSWSRTPCPKCDGRVANKVGIWGQKHKFCSKCGWSTRKLENDDTVLMEEQKGGEK